MGKPLQHRYNDCALFDRKRRDLWDPDDGTDFLITCPACRRYLGLDPLPVILGWTRGQTPIGDETGVWHLLVDRGDNHAVPACGTRSALGEVEEHITDGTPCVTCLAAERKIERETSTWLTIDAKERDDYLEPIA